MTTATFWDTVAVKYSKSPIEDVPAYEATLDRTRSFLNQNDHLLEFGCGTGGTALLLAPSVAQVTATDVSAGMIDIAKGKLTADAPDNVTFLKLDAMAPVPGTPVDVICGFNILHLVDDLPGALAHMRMQLKPGGLLITKTPCLGEKGVWLRIMIRLMRLVGKAPYVNPMKIPTLEQAMKNAGFELIDTAFFGKAAASPFIVARRP